MLIDPKERSRHGAEQQAKLLAASVAEPATPLQESWRDFIFAEIWTRPGLDLRSRYLIAMSSAANESDHGATRSYARGALANGELTQAELREAALHTAVYSGWTYGGVLDAGITAAAEDLGLPHAGCPPIQSEAWAAEARFAKGQASFEYNMKFPSPPKGVAYYDAGIVNFVFGEMWNRPGLDQRSRRWLTLVGVCNSSSNTPIQSHVWAAMATGNATPDEMNEFVLQYGVHAGWPRASFVQGVVREQSERVAKGLRYCD
jgi:4-carboxymuconolactone decarboxylase